MKKANGARIGSNEHIAYTEISGASTIGEYRERIEKTIKITNEDIHEVADGILEAIGMVTQIAWGEADTQ